MLTIDEDVFAESRQISDGVVNHGQILVQAGSQRLVDMSVVRLGDQANMVGASLDQRLHLRVTGGLAAHLAGGAEGDQLSIR